MDKDIQEVTQRLRQLEKQLTDELSVRVIDNGGSGLIEKLTDDVFRERIRSYRGLEDRSDSARANDWEDAVLARRKAAAASLAKEAERTLGGKYRGLCAAEELIHICAPCAAMTFDSLNKEYDIELAAAIWALDYLSEQGLYEEATGFFPRSAAQLRSVYLPDLIDATHGDDSLRAMKYILRSRNRGSKGFDESKAFADEADALRGTETAEEPSEDRRRFDSVIALIDNDTKNRLRESFSAYIRQLTDKILAYFAEDRKNLNGINEELLTQVRLQLSLYERSGQAAPLSVTAAPESGSPSAVIPTELSELAASVRKANALAAEKERELMRIERMHRCILLLPSAKADDELFGGFKGLGIQDPYALCFAFLLMLDEGSDLVWAYNLCYDVLAYACQALPWAGCEAVDPDDSSGEIQIDYERLAAMAAKTPDWDKDSTSELLNSKSVRSPLISSEGYISPAQLTCLTSGLIPPRRNDKLLFTKILLGDSDMTEREAQVWHAYFMLASAVAEREAGYALEGDMPPEPSDNAEADDSPSEKLRELKDEIKRLRRLINQLEHRNRECTEELAVKDSRLKAAATELSELRTMIRESADSDEAAPVTVSFPYTSSKRAVIFGGHDSWVKAIKPLLDNVRFISPSEQPNTGVIMNAGVVWIQTNALGHSSYYKIIDVIRKNDIKVCYFKYASAEKCAEQFALEDMQSAADEEETE